MARKLTGTPSETVAVTGPRAHTSPCFASTRGCRVAECAEPDPAAGRAALAGNEFVFDIQGHFLEYRVSPATRQARDFWTGFPQRGCGEQDQRLCFSIAHFMEEVFLKSDTSMVILSTLPIAPEGSPMSTELMDETRRLSEALCHAKRVLLHGHPFPNVGAPPANLHALPAA